MCANRSSHLLVSKLFLLVVLCAMLFPVPGSAQVTFSRDWNAGKRAVPDSSSGSSECGAIWRSINNLCSAVTKNIQHLTLCETRSLLKSLQTDESSMESSSGNNLPIFTNSHI